MLLGVLLCFLIIRFVKQVKRYGLAGWKLEKLGASQGERPSTPSTLPEPRLSLKAWKPAPYNFRVFLRDGKVIKLKRAKLESDGTLLVDNKLYPIQDVEPYLLVLERPLGGSKAYPMIILDAHRQCIYEFKEPPPDIEDRAKKAQLSPRLLDPKQLRFYVGGKVIEKLASKIALRKADMVMWVIIGASLVFFMEFFLLPLCGVRISIIPGW